MPGNSCVCSPASERARLSGRAAFAREESRDDQASCSDRGTLRRDGTGGDRRLLLGLSVGAPGSAAVGALSCGVQSRCWFPLAV